jgi:hypothetical protein
MQVLGVLIITKIGDYPACTVLSQDLGGDLPDDTHQDCMAGHQDRNACRVHAPTVYEPHQRQLFEQ